MNIQKKTAIIITGMNTFLTALKFILFSFTGSYVILAEAWHSFSDIGTSLLVLLAICRKLNQEKTGEQENADGIASGKEGQANFNNQNLEIVVSLVIGILLLMVSVLLIHQVFVGDKPDIKNPLTAGIVFIGFAIGSYLIYNFESAVGKKTNSVGLFSDSMHARADMTASLLAGFSLILYSLNIDIDRWAALAISVFILSFSLEVLVNVFKSVFLGDGENVFDFKSYHIVAYLFSPKELRNAVKYLDERSGMKFLHRPWIRLSLKSVYVLFPSALLLVYISTCFFSVATNEQAIVLRFDKPLNEAVCNAGLHIKFPWPVDKVLKLDTKRIKSLPIGNIPDSEDQIRLWTRVHGSEEEFLSGDNYFFFPFVIIHYCVNDLRAYLFSIVNPLEYMKNEGTCILTQMFAEKTFYDLVTLYRSQIESHVMKRLQQNLDAMNSGIEIVSINFKDIHPPISIAPYFEQVIAASQEKEKTINEALGYKNEKILLAMGDSVREIEKAKSYIIERVDRAQGDAWRFNLRKNAFDTNAPVLSKKLFLKTVQEVLPETITILYDPKAGHPSLWMGGLNNKIVTQQDRGENR